jgi:hypothetical protein
LNDKRYFATQDTALISIFSALWIALNLVVAPISFSLTGLPVIHDFLVFFTLLIAVWTTGKFGVASFVGLVGSAVVLLAGGPLPMIGFAASSIVFDLILLANHHKLIAKSFSIIITSTATVVAAYIAGNINGLLIIRLPLDFSATVWSGWNLAGAIFSLIMAFPIMSLLEKAKIQQIRSR